ncbi:MAG: FAD-binding oxidoreductase [Pyrinomonadaceae bacterium]
MADPVKQTLHGWGRYPVETCSVFAPMSDAQLYDILRTGLERSYVARGLGRSYGDTALNRDAGVISQLKLNRILSFDESTGLLDCEAGVSLAQLIERFVPQGFFPPVVPGTKFVTVGGAIANDIHGKNHHCDGSFGNFIEEIKLLKPNGEIITCSPTINESIFSATLGGSASQGLF